MTQKQLGQEYNGLRPAYSDEFLPPIARSLKMGGFVLLGMVGILFAFATTIKYNVAVNAAGTVVYQKTPVASELNSSHFAIKAYVAEQDVNRITVGQSVQLQINACSYSDYGTLQGTVRAVSPDVVALPTSLSRGTSAIRTTHNTEDKVQTSYYEVTIQPSTTSLARGSSLGAVQGVNRACKLRAGMNVKASILSSEQTILEFALRLHSN